LRKKEGQMNKKSSFAIDQLVLILLILIALMVFLTILIASQMSAGSLWGKITDIFRRG